MRAQRSHADAMGELRRLRDLDIRTRDGKDGVRIHGFVDASVIRVVTRHTVNVIPGPGLIATPRGAESKVLWCVPGSARNKDRSGRLMQAVLTESLAVGHPNRELPRHA